MQFGAPATDAGAKAHDGVAVNVSQALNGANRHALSEGSDNVNLLVAREDVHVGPNPACGTGPIRAGKITSLQL
jgi:hypothetical protein